MSLSEHSDFRRDFVRKKPRTLTAVIMQVETIGDAYMVVSGAPDTSKFHALYVADLAFAMLNCMKELIDPSSKQHLQIRIGAACCSI